MCALGRPRTWGEWHRGVRRPSHALHDASQRVLLMPWNRLFLLISTSSVVKKAALAADGLALWHWMLQIFLAL